MTIDTDFNIDVFNDTEFMTVAELSVEVGWPLEYTSTVGLVPYIRRLAGEPIGVEIGTGRGESAYLILDQCPKVKKLVTIDPFLEYKDWNSVVTQDYQNRFKAIAEKNFAQFGSRVEMIFKTAHEVVDTFLDRSLDFVYIDGDHSHKSVLQDLIDYYPKLREGGIIAIHDSNLESVKQAVRDYREKNKIRQPLHNSSNGLSFWYK